MAAEPSPNRNAASTAEASPAAADRDNPRQFSIGNMLAVTTLYAVLFGVLRWLETPPRVFVEITLLFTIVGLAQAFLYQGKRRHTASMIGGACFCVGAWVFDLIAVAWAKTPLLVVAPFDPIEGAFFGAIFGYLCGALVSGGFLVLGGLRRLAAGLFSKLPR